jgi:hypothetical protein
MSAAIADRDKVVNAFAIIAEHGRPVELIGEVLVIKTATADEAHMCVFLEPEIIRSLAPLGVKRLRFRVAAMSTREPKARESSHATETGVQRQALSVLVSDGTSRTVGQSNVEASR